MKWDDARNKHPTELYDTLKQLCDEFNASVNKDKRILTFFCNWCYKTKGSICFPCVDIKRLYCVDIKRLYLEKYGSDLEQILSRYK